ncbi:MAG TPA: HAMP domain-containing sensor histidine kinase [Ferruginibacter sp.]|nr:HAMP domain-containing sensor histidine kinase [Ferruginibacter sp.]
MKKLSIQVLLMITAIAGVAGFQLYWLKQTYLQEKKSLSIKADLAFRDAMQDLQLSKLDLDISSGTPGSGSKIRVHVNDSVQERVTVQLNGKKGIISTINVLRKQVAGKPGGDSSLKENVLISNERTYFERHLTAPDSNVDKSIIPPREHIIRLLYGVDSLWDTLKIKEINDAVNSKLRQRSIMVPFTIIRLDSLEHDTDSIGNEVTVGFAHPVTYAMTLGNVFPFILKEISLPILFSVLLTGITLLSFILLYRNLLQQRKLTAIKNEFIGNITHELKTPIATVSVAIEAMKDFDALQSPEKTREYLGIAGQELGRLSMLVDKVLRLSMFENKEVELSFERFDVSMLLQEVIRSMQIQFEKRGADVEVQYKGTDFFIDADRMHVASVIYNLLDNAIKYSKDIPKIRILAAVTGQDFILQISDNGIGIDPAYGQRVFEKFFRVPHGNLHNVKGYGLGLSYAAHIAEKHKGSIKVESDGENGATFIITLPRKHGN